MDKKETETNLAVDQLIAVLQIYYEAGYQKKNIHADIAAGNTLRKDVKQHDAADCNEAQAIQYL